MRKKKKKPTDKLTGAFETQPISQPDRRQEGTGVALPNDGNVTENKKWVDFNHK